MNYSTSHRFSLTSCLFILFQVGLIFPSASQTVLQRVIGNASGLSSFAYGPIYRNQGNTGLLNYSRHAYLYTAAELNIPAGSKIISLEWMKKDTGRVLGNNTFNIWLSNTAATTFPTAATWTSLTNGVSQVFGSTTFSITGGANTYQLATFNQAAPNDSFTYTGGSLQILVDWAKQGYATAAIPFYYLGATGKALGTASTSAMNGNTTLTASTYGNNRPTLRITYVTVPTCTGTPAPGNTTCNVPGACAGASFILGMQYSTPGSLVTFQWQSADEPGFSMNLTNLGSGSTQTTTQSSAKYYRCLVTCGSTGMTTASNPLLLPMNPGYQCFCPSTAVSTSDEEVFKVVFGSYKNCSNCTVQAPGPNSSAGVYSNYQTTPPIPMKKGVAIPFLVEVGLCNPSSYPNRTAIFMDLNRNGVLSDSGEIVYSSPTSINGAHTEAGTIYIPDSIPNGLLGMRIITIEQNTAITNPCAVYNWGETEDYVVDLQSSGFCSGTPNPGSTQIDFPGSCTAVTASYEICKGNSVTLSLSNTPIENGITYQWYNSAGLITGATGTTYTTPAIVAPTSYYCAVSCSSGTSVYTANSTPIAITIKSFLACYCGSAAANASDEDIFTFGIGNGSNSSSCTTPATGSGSVLNMYSNFTNLGSLSNVVAGTTVPFTIDVNDCDIPAAPYYAFGAAVWIDFNQNGSFNDAGEQVFVEANATLGPRTITGTISIPCTALSGTTMVRVIAAESISGASLTPCLYYGFGETEDYLITLLPKAESVGYNFGTASSPGAAASSGVPVNNVTVSSLSQGNNANTTQSTLFMAASTPSNYSGASGGSYAGIAARNRNLQVTDSSAYFQFTLTPATGYQVVLDSISLGTYSAATGPTTIDIRTSANNYATSIGSYSVSANSTWNFSSQVINRVLSNQQLTVRIYGYVNGGPGTITTGSTVVNWLIDDINVKFGVRCIPPCSLTLNAYNTPIACFGGTSSIVSYASGSIEPVNFKLNNGAWQSSGIFSGLTVGTYTVTAQDANACTASAVVAISQPAPVSSNTAVTACDTYTWPVNNQAYSASGTYYSSGLTSAGCPRSDTLALVINASTSSSPVSATACNSYVWNGNTYTVSGTYTYTSLNTAGCVHTQTLNLTILSSSSSQSVTACNSYNWPVNNVTYTSSGTYSFTIGCAVSILNLTIVPSSTTTTSATACNSYLWTVNNTTYTASGTYSSMTGCVTSILNVTIVPSSTSTASATACDSYTWTVNNTTYSNSGTYTSVTGCVTSILNLTITPSTTNTSSASACNSYTWPVNNVTYTASGTYTSVIGCQTNILNLTITPSSSNSNSVTACSTYTWPVNNVTYTASGTYTNVNACVTSTLQLTIIPSTSSSSSASACNTYTWPVNNVTYTASGTYTFVSGCNTSTLNLTIILSSTATTTATACDSYTWAVNNITYTSSGTYSSVMGCVTSILNVTVTQSTTSTTTATACNSYTWTVNNTTYTNSGTYSSVMGCATSILNLNITPSTTNTSSAGACNSYTWPVNNVTYTASGTYTAVIGCQTNILNLSITPSSSNSNSVTACSSYTWPVDNVTYTASGTYTNVNACVTSTLQLTIIPSTSSGSSASSCNFYTWPVNNVTYTASGTYTFVSGCNTSTLNLTIIPSSTATTTATACDSYTWTVNNITYTSSGTYTNVTGCATSILNLTILPSTTSTITATACASYTWTVNNTTYTNSGTYSSVTGCATSILNLVITPSTTTTSSASACNSYTWPVNNVTYTASGIYSQVSNCVTSILNLTIIPSTTTNTSASACDSYTWSLNNVTYTNSGTYTYVVSCQTNNLNLAITASSSSASSATGCGSYTWSLNNVTYTASGTYAYVVGCHTNLLNLTITPGSSSSQSVTACDSYTWPQNNVTYTTSGVYTYPVGCHLYTLNLSIFQSTTSNQSVSACSSYTWNANNQTYTASGVYTYTVGCQTQQLTLTIVPSTSSTTSASACGSYTWTVNNITYTNSGIYNFVSGCHTSILNLLIIAPSSSNVTATACGSYTWPVNGTTYIQSGTYTNVSGCVTTTLQLTITPDTLSSNTATACDSFTWPVNGVTYTASGTYIAIVGCQTNMLILSVFTSTSVSQSATACNAYTWPVNNLTYTSSGTYTHLVGCQTNILTLTIAPSTSSLTSATACDTYTWSVNNSTYTASGTYSVVSNCHTSILNLTLQPSGQNTSTITACTSYTWSLNGVTYTASGTYTHQVGCNTQLLQLTIQPSSSSSGSTTACNSYTWPVNGVQYTTSGSYTAILGCTTYQLNLTINYQTSSTTNIVALGSYTWPVNGVTYTHSGTYTSTTLNASGCLHVSTLFLQISTPLSLTLIENQPISCHGNNDGSAIASAAGDQPFTFRIDGGPFNNTNGLFYNLAPGTHTICVKDVHGTILCQTITFIEPDPLFMTFNIDSVASCQGNDGAISAYITGGTNLLQGYLTWWTNSNGDTVNDILTNNFAMNLTGLPADSYTVTVEDDNGCFFSADTILVTTSLSVTASATPILCNGGTSVITPIGVGGVPYDTLTYLVNGLPLQPSYPAGTYTITVIDAKSCTATDVISISWPSQGWTQNVSACASYVWPATGLTYTTSGTYTTTLLGSAGCDSVVHLNLNITSCATELNLTLLLQGFYTGSSSMVPVLLNQGVSTDPTVTDSIDVSLYADQAPYTLIATVRVPLSTTGQAQCIFPPLSGYYYIGVRGRNTLNTWSANPVLLGSVPSGYNFSTAANKAYGDNQYEVEPGIWALYTGDINADDNIDITDIGIIDIELSNFSYGYNAADTNGDGNVDILDSPVVDLNVTNFIYAMYP